MIEPAVLTIAQAEVLLGASRPRIMSYITADHDDPKHLPAYMEGPQYRIPRKAIDEWITRQTKQGIAS
jgi:excisionase family DNA binding protein